MKAIIFVLGALAGAVVTFSLMQPPPLPPDIQALVQKYATPVSDKPVPGAALPPASQPGLSAKCAVTVDEINAELARRGAN